MKTICPPSRAGKGIRLKRARFAEIRGSKMKRLTIDALVLVAIRPIVAIGPPTSEVESWKVMSIQSDFKTDQAIIPERTKLSPRASKNGRGWSARFAQIV